jgi:hypothetical protein
VNRTIALVVASLTALTAVGCGSTLQISRQTASPESGTAGTSPLAASATGGPLPAPGTAAGALGTTGASQLGPTSSALGAGTSSSTVGSTLVSIAQSGGSPLSPTASA